jgi:hypothetical protein
MNDSPHARRPADVEARTIGEILADPSESRRSATLRALITQAQRALVEIPDDAKLIVSLDHPRLGVVQIGVASQDGSDITTLAETAYGDITKAIGIAAAQSIDPGSYDTQEDYQNAVDRRAQQFEVVDIRRTGDTHRWRVRIGSSLRDPDIEVFAQTKSDAEFLARWTQGRNHQPGVRLDTIEGFLAELFSIEIANVHEEPVSLVELYQALALALTPGNEDGTWGSTLRGGETWEVLHEHMRKLHMLYGMPQPPRPSQNKAAAP